MNVSLCGQNQFYEWRRLLVVRRGEEAEGASNCRGCDIEALRIDVALALCRERESCERKREWEARLGIIMLREITWV